MEPKLFTSMYSRAIGALLLAFVVALLLASSVPPTMAAYRANATYIDYQPEPNWEWSNTVNCPPMDNDHYPDITFRSRHRWTEFCGDLGPYSGDCGCHCCLQVTNQADENASVTVRIIDICSFDPDVDPVVWMDKVAFDLINTVNGQATMSAQGILQLKVNYEIADCGDP